MSKQLYILNPHRDDFIWEPLYFRFIKRKALKKYNYIGNEFQTNNKLKLIFTDNSSGIVPQKILNFIPSKLRRIIIKFELKRWAKINNISRKFNIAWLDNKFDDYELSNIFFFQLTITNKINSLAPLLKKFKEVYVHLSHYYLDPFYISQVYKPLSNVYLCGDSNISQHPFFLKYFNWYSNKFILIPFFISERFKIINTFNNRINKIITTGTFHNIEDYPKSLYLKKDLGVTSFHNNRRNIYENKEVLKNVITCYNSPWQQAGSNWFTKWVRSKNVAQKKYFAFDIVEAYNKYTHALVGEEIGGFLGIGTLEAMACGCMPFASKNAVVGVINDIKLYIALHNNNNLSNLSNLVQSYPNSESLMLVLSNFVRNNFSKEQALQKFLATFKL